MPEKTDATKTSAAPGQRFARQAIILCHGIGEHTPMNTLTNFVWTINRPDDEKLDDQKPDDKQGDKKKEASTEAAARAAVTDQLIFRSYPQDIADNLELRTFSAIESNNRITDYYELYWSHLKVRENINLVFFKWLLEMMKIGKESVPPNLAKAFRILACARRLLFVFVLVIFVLLVSLFFIESALSVWIIAGMIGAVPGAIFAYYFYLPNMINIVGDVARYLSVKPENISSRQAIRRAGIDLLNGLHEAREADDELRYERIIVVGHSLGSIIAYDVILNCFAQRNGYVRIEDYARLSKDGVSLPTEGTQFVTISDDSFLEKLRETAEALDQEQARLTIDRLADAFRPAQLDTNLYEVRSYPDDADLRTKQKAFWRAQRALFEATRLAHAAHASTDKDPSRHLDWRVSDFITLGSPLTYAAILLAKAQALDKVGKAEEKSVSREAYYAKRQEKLDDARRCERNWPLNGELDHAMSVGVLPTAPPRPMFWHSLWQKLIFYFPFGRRAVLANNSPFALTRWTNLYCPSSGHLLSGDIISGPLGPVFGLGVKDVPLHPQEIAPRWYGPLSERVAHTYYWIESRTDWNYVGQLKGGAPRASETLRRPMRITALLDALDLKRVSKEWPENAPADEDAAQTPAALNAAPPRA